MEEGEERKKKKNVQVFPTAPSPTTTHLTFCIAIFYYLISVSGEFLVCVCVLCATAGQQGGKGMAGFLFVAVVGCDVVAARR